MPYNKGDVMSMHMLGQSSLRVYSLIVGSHFQNAPIGLNFDENNPNESLSKLNFQGHPR